MCVLRGPDLVFELVNVAFSMLAGGRDLIGKTLREGLPESEGQDYPCILENILKTGEVHVGRKTRVLLQDAPDCEIEEHYIDFVAQPIMGANGEVTGIFIEGNDVTDHVRTEQRQALLIRELHHRVRNMLATVQGVMTTTANTSANIEDFQKAFSGRIASLARTHAVITEQLQQSVSFQQLLVQELGPYSDDQGLRIRLSGPAVDLPSQIAVPLGMAVHELTTNAVRHGALAKEEGRIEVGWSLIDRNGELALLCEWSEFAEPPVTPRCRDGFGSMLLERVLPQQIRAEVTADFAPDGFRLRMAVPLQNGR
jgi:two-component sensor histidine kinase